MCRLQKQPIAVFDSGVGGISVLRELVKIMPNEDYIYLGDSKNAPYGMKTKQEVLELTLNCAKNLFDGVYDTGDAGNYLFVDCSAYSGCCDPGWSVGAGTGTKKPPCRSAYLYSGLRGFLHDYADQSVHQSGLWKRRSSQNGRSGSQRHRFSGSRHHHRDQEKSNQRTDDGGGVVVCRGSGPCVGNRFI